MDHLKDFIALHTRWVDGRVEVLHYNRYVTLEDLKHHCCALYVCPRTGILRAQNGRRRRPKPPEDPDRKRLPDGTELRRLQGIWYHVELAPMPVEMRDRYRCYDQILRCSVGSATGEQLYSTYGRTDRYAI